MTEELINEGTMTLAGNWLGGMAADNVWVWSGIIAAWAIASIITTTTKSRDVWWYKWIERIALVVGKAKETAKSKKAKK